MFCYSCGKRIIRDSSFCDSCGLSVKESPELKIETDNSSNELLTPFIIKIPRPTTKKLLFVIAPGALLISLFWIIGTVYLSDQHKITSTQAQLQITQKELADIKTEIEQGRATQEKQISEAKQEISFLKNRSEELQNSFNKQTVGNTSFSASSLVSTQGKYIVKVVCIDASSNMNQGSGVIFSRTPNNTTVVITNQHVIPKSYTHDLTYPCLVAYSSDPTSNFTNTYYANPVYWADRASMNTMSNYDFGYLEIKQEVNINGDQIIPISGASLILADNQRPTVCKSSELQAGKELIVLGYAGVGGNYLSVKEGIVSGFDGAYITTSAKIEQGDSGGGTFLKESGCLIGMPTFSISGKLESLGRVLALSYISSYILSIPELGN